MIFGIIILAIFAVLGVLVGQNINIPYSSYEYVAVAILASLDSVFGALAASTGKKNFKMNIFLSGFFFNSVFAIFLVYLGSLLNVQITLAVTVVFAGRILNNFSIIRRDLMESAPESTKKYIARRKLSSNKPIKTDLEVQREKDAQAQIKYREKILEQERNEAQNNIK